MSDRWLLGAERDEVSITADWAAVSEARIDGVEFREVRNVPTAYGHLTELFRQDWGFETASVGQVFQSVLLPGRLSAWHSHRETTDRLFIASGSALVVLYDAREGSPTEGQVLATRLSILRPQLVIVPPQVWHGVKSTGAEPAFVINMVDIAYRYDDPDHYRLPPDAPEIPFDIVNAL